MSFAFLGLTLLLLGILTAWLFVLAEWWKEVMDVGRGKGDMGGEGVGKEEREEGERRRCEDGKVGRELNWQLFVLATWGKGI